MDYTELIVISVVIVVVFTLLTLPPNCDYVVKTRGADKEDFVTQHTNMHNQPHIPLHAHTQTHAHIKTHTEPPIVGSILAPVHVHRQTITPPTYSHNFTIVRPEIVTKIYKLLYIFDKTCRANGIEYWIEGGTFLGAVRHGGIIPWDDDGDVDMWEDDSLRLKALEPVFNSYNIVLKETWFGYKIYFKGSQKIKGYKWLYPAVDIFLMKVDSKDNVIYAMPKARKAFGHCSMQLSQLYPLSPYKFGSFEMMGPSPAAATPFFSKCYGSDWATHAYQMYDHQNEKRITKRVKVELTEADKHPAYPIEFEKM
jgi:phosphorylcholine metabolism protein LicD